MEKLEFKIEIDAPAKRVWFSLWDDFFYRDWTRVFCEGSYMLTNWELGGRVQFLSPNGSGMYSVLSEKVDFERMCFTHIGEIQGFQELPLDNKSKLWSGGQENYYLQELNGKTILTIRMDITKEHKEYFLSAFPKGLDRVKQNAENFMIVVNASIDAPINKVWQYWNEPDHITKWCFANEEWHAPKAENDLRVKGNFSTRMEAKDGSFGFDFGGEYLDIVDHSMIYYIMSDGRKVKIDFSELEGKVQVKESFTPEEQNPYEMQKMGWQAILNNFKNYVKKS